MRIILSPHRDDAVLSLGPGIRAWVKAGELVTVATVFSGGPEGELTAAAIEDATRYGGDPVEIRAREDEQALSQIGAARVDLGFPEVIYRWRADRRARCDSLADIFGQAEPGDSELIGTIARSVTELIDTAGSSDLVLHVPLGIGSHIDHVIVKAAALSLDVSGTTVEFYEDQPYAMRQNYFDDSVRWPVTSDVDIAEWLDAIGCYESQIQILFTDHDWRSELALWVKAKRKRQEAIESQ